MAVRKRGKRWYFDFQIKDQITARPKRYREVIPTATTKWQAEQAERQKRSEVFDANYGIRQLGTQSFVEFVKEIYLPWAKANKRTWRNDEYIANQWCDVFKGEALREVSPFAIDKYKRERMHSTTKRGTTRSPASVNMELAVLSRVFSLAIDMEQAATNPCRKVKKLRVDNQRNRYLSADEESALMAQLTGRRKHLRPVVELALGTGMRRGEVLALTWRHVDFMRGVIHVTNTKSAKDRIVPMSQRVRDVLLSLRANRKSDHVFDSTRGKGKRIVDIKKGFVAACNDAEIVDFHFHDLRHTFATRLGDQGCTANTIAALLGHSNTQMTARYTHATDDALRSAVEGAQKTRVTIASQTAKQPPALTAVNY